MRKFIFGFIFGFVVTTTVFMFPPDSIREIMWERYRPQMVEELKKHGVTIRNTESEPTEEDGYDITIEELTSQSPSVIRLGMEDMDRDKLLETRTTDSHQKNIYAKPHDVLSHNESLNWLRKKGYTVQKSDDGYDIIYKSSSYIKEESLRGGGTKVVSIRDFQSGRDVSLRYERGNIHITIPK